MSVIWLAAWLIRRRPRVEMFKSWNNWGIALAISLALDLISSVTRAPRARHRHSEMGSTSNGPSKMVTKRHDSSRAGA